MACTAEKLNVTTIPGPITTITLACTMCGWTRHLSSVDRDTIGAYAAQLGNEHLASQN